MRSIIVKGKNYSEDCEKSLVMNSLSVVSNGFAEVLIYFINVDAMLLCTALKQFFQNKIVIIAHVQSKLFATVNIVAQKNYGTLELLNLHKQDEVFLY